MRVNFIKDFVDGFLFCSGAVDGIGVRRGGFIFLEALEPFGGLYESGYFVREFREGYAVSVAKEEVPKSKPSKVGGMSNPSMTGT